MHSASDSHEPSPSSPPQVPTGPLEVAPDCWMVGRRNPQALLQCNTYIRTFPGREPLHVCVDPGSMVDYSSIEQNVTQLTGGMEEIQAFSLNHQDPDVIGNATHLLAANPEATVMVTEDVWRLAQHLLPRPQQLRFANPVQRKLDIRGSQHYWKLVATPFCHFRGAMAFYDQELQILFTGDLFGGLNQIGRVHLTAQEGDWNGIAQFHQIYMPTREVLRYAVRQIRALDPPVKVIAPQHGYIITGGLVDLFLDRMHELLVGHDLLAADLDEAHLQGYQQVLDQMLSRARKVLGPKVVANRLTAHANDDIEGYIRVHENNVQLDREGYVAVAKVFARLAWGKPMAFQDALRSDVLEICAECEIPIPPIGAGIAEGLPHDFVGREDLAQGDHHQGGIRQRRQKKIR